MMADEELGDEVKVFRRDEDADDDPMGETSEQQLADDKKEAVMEAELDTATGTRNPLLGSVKQEPYVKAEPSPSFPLMPGLIPAQFSPAFPMMLPILMQSPYALRSPSFMPLMGAALSPSFGMFPTSPFFGPAAAALVAQQQRENAMPLQMRAGPLNPLNHPMRMPPYMPMSTEQRKQGGGKVKKEDHIKKPLNAFMWFMKENRKKLLDEIGNHEKQSAELNKELGKRWHDLPKEEQQKYFEMAKKDREDHKEKYPQWSARENYAVNKKKIKKRRDKSVEIAASENSDQKKCRARFGVSNTEMWCKFCKRKKKCEYATDRSEEHSEPKDKSEASSSSGTPSPNMPMATAMANMGAMNPQLSHAHMQAMLMQMQLSQSIGPSPLAQQQQSSTGISPADANASDSESDVDDDEEIDPTITQQTHEVIMQESVCML